MSEEIYPYIQVLFAKTFPSIGWPNGFFREEEAKAAIERKVAELVESQKIKDIVSPSEFTDFIYLQLKEKSVIREHVEKFAGQYVTFNNAQYKQYINKVETGDPLSTAANRIGSRFFSDVFDGYRAQQSGELGAPLPREVVQSQPWSQLTIEKATFADIKERADGLIAAIEQADLTERQRKNALAHAHAVVRLLEAPDPPWKTVVELLNNPVLAAILNALTIVQLIMGSFS